MSFSNLIGGGSPASDTSGGASTPKHASFGDTLTNYFEKKYPIAGGALSSLGILPNGQQQTQPAVPVVEPTGELPDYSNTTMPLVPTPQSPVGGHSGLATLLKFFG